MMLKSSDVKQMECYWFNAQKTWTQIELNWLIFITYFRIYIS